jgi:hypothetical protein
MVMPLTKVSAPRMLLSRVNQREGEAGVAAEGVVEAAVPEEQAGMRLMGNWVLVRLLRAIGVVKPAVEPSKSRTVMVPSVRPRWRPG